MALPDAFTEQLAARFGARFSTGTAVREQHGIDESAYAPMPPDAVLFAESNAEVVEAMRCCREHRVPLIPFGAGTSLEGHLLALQGGLSLDLSRMNRVLAVHAEDLSATVQAGVTRKQLNEELRSSGLFFPIDPGADASIGGMAATRASGTNAVRYGTMRENVLSLSVVTADGELLRTTGRARKSSAGYDLTRLFVGSEGTLGIITEVTLRLYPQPEALSAAICQFPDLDSAVRTVIETIQFGIPVARVELMDATAVRAVNRYSKLALREATLLLFEFHGSAAGVREQAGQVQQLAHQQGGLDFEWTLETEARNRLWAARHNAFWATRQLQPGARAITTDVCVPISRLAECIADAQRELRDCGLLSSIIGHVGDGNFHVVMLIDPDDPAQRERAEQANRAIVERALSCDGTCTGEHGVGLHKIDFMEQEHEPAALNLMRSLKRTLDPLNLLNPGKVLRL